MSDDKKTMKLNLGDHFTLNSPKDTTFDGLSVYLRNNGNNIINVTTDGETIVISVEKKEK